MHYLYLSLLILIIIILYPFFTANLTIIMSDLHF